MEVKILNAPIKARMLLMMTTLIFMRSVAREFKKERNQTASVHLAVGELVH